MNTLGYTNVIRVDILGYSRRVEFRSIYRWNLKYTLELKGSGLVYISLRSLILHLVETFPPLSNTANDVYNIHNLYIKTI